MRHCFWILASLLVVGTAFDVQAQAPRSLLTRGPGVPCQIVMGRIRLDEHRGLPTRSESLAHEASGQRETLCIQSHAGQSVVRYEVHTQDEHFTLDFTSHGELQIVHEKRTASVNARVVFVQPRSGDLRLELHDHHQQRVVQAASLWHFLLCEPKLSRERLVPLIARLRPDWDLIAEADEVAQALHLATKTQQTSSTTRTTALLASLSAGSFAERQAAYRELRAQGPALLPQLAQVDAHGFDAEQRRRVAELRSELTPSSPDTPQRVARWLSGDQAFVRALREPTTPTATTIP